MPQARPTPWQAPGLRVPHAGAGRRLLAAPAGCGGGPAGTAVLGARAWRDGRPRHALPVRHPWIPLAPAIAAFLLALAANLAGDGLRDLLEDH